MKNSIGGISLRLFQLWLYAPLIIFIYIDYQTLLAPKVSILIKFVVVATSIFLG